MCPCVNRVLSDHCALSVRYPCVIRALSVRYPCVIRPSADDQVPKSRASSSVHDS